MSMMVTNITIRSVTTKSKANTSILKGGDVLLSLVFNDKNSRSLQISAKHIVYRCFGRNIIIVINTNNIAIVITLPSLEICSTS